VILSDLLNGSRVFIDANVFLYHFGKHPVWQPACQQFLERISRGEIAGLTSSDVLSDIAHRLMTLEAADKYGWPMAGIAQRLKQHPGELQGLTRFRQAVDSVATIGVQVLAVDASLVTRAAAVSQQHGLLSGDALVVAVMEHQGVTNLATNDADFDRVPWIARYAPA
jgi:predicted nucleic acid-binding protein